MTVLYIVGTSLLRGRAADAFMSLAGEPGGGERWAT